EPFRRRQHTVGESPRALVVVEQAASTLAAQPVADVVADDRGDHRDDDHCSDREMPVRRVDGGRDERRLPRQPEARRFEADDREQEEQPVVLDEVGNPARVQSGSASSGARKIAAVRIAVPRELEPGERRVALVPDAVGRLVQNGFEVVVEPGAGEAAAFTDDGYAGAGATVGTGVWDADGVVKVRKPNAEE